MSDPPNIPRHQQYKTVLEWAGALEEFAQSQHDQIERLRESLRLRLIDQEEREKSQREREERLRGLFDVRTWGRAQHDAWHKALPDTAKAFADLLATVESPERESGR